jgi:hypothetical protein
MEDARPALYVQAIRDNPYTYTPDGTPVHRTSFTKAQLAAFVSSFYVQRLVVTKDVTLDEMVGMFTQQGVAFCWDTCLSNEEKRTPEGVVVPRITQNTLASVQDACDVLARALGYWSRLELCMDASLGSQLRPLPDQINLQSFAGFDCTATRAWIQFSNRPTAAMLTYSESTCQSLVNSWPFWLDRFITYLADVYVENKLEGYTETAFVKMTDAAQNSPLHGLWWIAKDRPCLCHKHQVLTNKFKCHVKLAVTSSSYTMTTHPQARVPRRTSNKLNDRLHFSRACVAFCLQTIKEATDYSALFSGACADENGQTPERMAFAKSLAPMGVRVVKWCDDTNKPYNAIKFPPYNGETVNKNLPMVLLEFMDRL